MIDDDKPTLEAALEHHGVKGMKWGVHRDPHTGVRPLARTLHNSRFGQHAVKNAEKHMAKQTIKQIEKQNKEKAKVDKKQAKVRTRAEQDAFYQAKATRIMETAAKDPESLIALRTQYDSVIVTGKQFVDHMTNGGLMDIRRTDIYATRPNGQGPYVLNPNINARFQPTH